MNAVSYVRDGITYQVAEEFARELLADKGMSLHSLTPFQIIDKIGFLKTGDEAMDIFANIHQRIYDPIVFTVQFTFSDMKTTP